MMSHRTLGLTTLLVAALAATTLSACNRAEDKRTVGEKVDGAVATVENQAEKVAAEARVVAEKAKQGTAAVMDNVALKAKDAAITTAINAELTKDTQLSALSINVDTVEGRVALRGSAPDGVSRNRASKLASEVDGVKAVDNQLTVSPKS